MCVSAIGLLAMVHGYGKKPTHTVSYTWVEKGSGLMVSEEIIAPLHQIQQFTAVKQCLLTYNTMLVSMV